MNKNKISNFLTPDISYLLGLITGRGEIQISNEIKRIIIDFEYKTLESKAIKKVFDQKLHIQTSLDPVVLRLQNIGINTQKVITNKNLSLVLRWQQEDIAWLFIKFLINGTRFNYHDFLIPDPIFETTGTNQKEFIRGLSDVTGYVRKSNNDQRGRHRVYLEISNKNWFLPPQLCQLIQGLNVPVQNINYGHPNMRDPQALEEKSTGWSREHQMKIYADDFDNIGFYISHKNEALIELSDYNKANFEAQQKLCDGIVSRERIKAVHLQEKSDRLPSSLKGKHFNSYKEICKCLNCYMQKS